MLLAVVSDDDSLLSLDNNGALLTLQIRGVAALAGGGFCLGCTVTLPGELGGEMRSNLPFDHTNSCPLPW